MARVGELRFLGVHERGSRDRVERLVDEGCWVLVRVRRSEDGGKGE